MARMRQVEFTTALIFISAFSCPAFAEHRPPMPRPQKISYGKGMLPLAGLSIRFTSPPSEDDSFAARELAQALEAETGERPAIFEREVAGPAIVLARTGALDPLPMPGETPGPDSREAYHLKVTPTGAEIRSSSSAGVFYGVETLRQLVEGRGKDARLPEVAIDDWPSLAYRGTMVDMSHGPLPTEQEVERQLDFLARWKANQYYFYSEASIELAGYSILNPGGRFSKEEVRRIVAYGRARHIDVVPCLELYGHLHDLFRVERYSSLSDLPHGTEFDPRNPKVAALLDDWIDQLAELFPSRFVHVGFDETFQIELAAKQPGGAGEPAKLFVEQLGHVARRFAQHGKTTMAWGDIIVKYPEILEQLPPGLIAVAWEYDPRPERYRHWLEPLAGHHVPEMIATGVTSWNQIAPDFKRSFENVDTFLAAGRAAGTLGIINTIWTDDAQMLMREIWPGMAYGMVASWETRPVERARFFSDFAALTLPPTAAPEAAAGLDDLARAETTLQSVIGDDTMLALWGDPFAPARLKQDTDHYGDLTQARLEAEDAEEHFFRARSLGASADWLDSLILAARLVDYAGEKFQTPTDLVNLWQKLGPKRPKDDEWWNTWESQVVYQDHSRLVDLMDTITELRGEFQAAWLAQYRPYRLASALGRWDAENEYWRRLQEKMARLSETIHEGDPLPALDSLLR